MRESLLWMEESRREGRDFGSHGSEAEKLSEKLSVVDLDQKAGREASRQNFSYIPRGSCRQKGPECILVGVGEGHHKK